MRVVIEKSKWNRGKGPGQGEFFDGQTYCALGFCLKAAGVLDTALKGRGCVSELIEEEIDVLEPFVKVYADGFLVSTELAIEITTTNDSSTITDDERMQRLSLFLEPAGFDLEFVE